MARAVAAMSTEAVQFGLSCRILVLTGSYRYVFPFGNNYHLARIFPCCYAVGRKLFP